MSAYTEASRAVFEVFDRHHAAGRGAVDRRGLPRRRRAAPGVGHADARSRRSCGATCSTGSGCAITVGVARTKFLAKVASGVAKPDGLLVVPPDGELAFLHPLPVERLWGVGPVTAAKLHERGITHRRRGGRSCPRALWSPCSGQASGRHLHALAHNRDPRPVQVGPAAALDRVAARPRPVAAARPQALDAVLVAAGRPGRLGRMRDAGRVGPHRRAAPALRRLHPGHPLAHADRGPPPTPTPSSPRPATCWRRPRRSSSGRACTLVGVAVANLDDDRRRPAGPAVRRRTAAAPSTPRSTRCASASARRPSPGPCCSAATRACRCRCCPTDRRAGGARPCGARAAAAHLVWP